MTGKILIVEDNPDDEALVKRALQLQNIVNDVVVVRDGVEALDYLFGLGSHLGRDLSVPPILMLLDLQLPRLGGLEVLKTLRIDERYKRLPIVMMSAAEEEALVSEGHRLGASGVLTKPMRFEQFHAVVSNLGLSWMLISPEQVPVGLPV